MATSIKLVFYCGPGEQPYYEVGLSASYSFLLAPMLAILDRSPHWKGNAMIVIPPPARMTGSATAPRLAR
jgi:hypothetical protein